MNPDTTVGTRPYTVNGVAIDSKRFVYTVNTGTGEVSRLEIKPNYKPGNITSVVKDDRLMGADGIIVDGQDNLWIACNVRNALMKVTQAGEITEIAANGPEGPLHFPAELKEAGNADLSGELQPDHGSERRDNRLEREYRGSEASLALAVGAWRPSGCTNAASGSGRLLRRGVPAASSRAARRRVSLWSEDGGTSGASCRSAS